MLLFPQWCGDDESKGTSYSSMRPWNRSFQELCAFHRMSYMFGMQALVSTCLWGTKQWDQILGGRLDVTTAAQSTKRRSESSCVLFTPMLATFLRTGQSLQILEFTCVNSSVNRLAHRK